MFAFFTLIKLSFRVPFLFSLLLLVHLIFWVFSLFNLLGSLFLLIKLVLKVVSFFEIITFWFWRYLKKGYEKVYLKLYQVYQNIYLNINQKFYSKIYQKIVRFWFWLNKNIFGGNRVRIFKINGKINKNANGEGFFVNFNYIFNSKGKLPVNFNSIFKFNFVLINGFLAFLVIVVSLNLLVPEVFANSNS